MRLLRTIGLAINLLLFLGFSYLFMDDLLSTRTILSSNNRLFLFIFIVLIFSTIPHIIQYFKDVFLARVIDPRVPENYDILDTPFQEDNINKNAFLKQMKAFNQLKFWMILFGIFQFFIGAFLITKTNLVTSEFHQFNSVLDILFVIPILMILVSGIISMLYNIYMSQMTYEMKEQI